MKLEERPLGTPWIFGLYSKETQRYHSLVQPFSCLLSFFFPFFGGCNYFWSYKYRYYFAIQRVWSVVEYFYHVLRNHAVFWRVRRARQNTRDENRDDRDGIKNDCEAYDHLWLLRKSDNRTKCNEEKKAPTYNEYQRASRKRT